MGSRVFVKRGPWGEMTVDVGIAFVQETAVGTVYGLVSRTGVDGTGATPVVRPPTARLG
jgi:hypothetical protein